MRYIILAILETDIFRLDIVLLPTFTLPLFQGIRLGFREQSTSRVGHLARKSDKKCPFY